MKQDSIKTSERTRAFPLVNRLYRPHRTIFGLNFFESNKNVSDLDDPPEKIIIFPGGEKKKMCIMKILKSSRPS